MPNRRVPAVAALTLALAVTGACNRERASTDATPGIAPDAQRARDDETAKLRGRVAELEREYADANQEVKSGAKTATAGLREELKEDVANVRQAVDDLGTTTPENWWDRHERAMRRTAEDVEADVKRLAGNVTPAPVPKTVGTAGEQVSTRPFTSRRDEFVKDLRARVDAMERALGDLNASGARETEVEDTRARAKKLGEDLDRLGKASADDWWDVTRERVSDYVARVEDSIGRLDDNRP
jgi:hypothetical protein